ncbi:hypothetical protein NP233_g9993 [Leucocoprinus birnbaumii]|uniref:Uncharacterized protein n=1 Tax=Leucocoprinus birnbaumii TaxID=56174 RepID=A0AAD5VL60_9AGAR|nr:hypothetical protein NP233_g9993 [Leucocoprinus birnbaumii]
MVPHPTLPVPVPAAERTTSASPHATGEETAEEDNVAPRDLLDFYIADAIEVQFAVAHQDAMTQLEKVDEKVWQMVGRLEDVANRVHGKLTERQMNTAALIDAVGDQIQRLEKRVSAIESVLGISEESMELGSSVTSQADPSRSGGLVDIHLGSIPAEPRDIPPPLLPLLDVTEVPGERHDALDCVPNVCPSPSTNEIPALGLLPGRSLVMTLTSLNIFPLSALGTRSPGIARAVSLPPSAMPQSLRDNVVAAMPGAAAGAQYSPRRPIANRHCSLPPQAIVESEQGTLLPAAEIITRQHSTQALSAPRPLPTAQAVLHPPSVLAPATTHLMLSNPGLLLSLVPFPPATAGNENAMNTVATASLPTSPSTHLQPMDISS